MLPETPQPVHPAPVDPAPSPLVRLAWVKEAHRALRLAVTGIRSCRMRYHDQVEAGQQQMNQACNCLLQLQHLPSMPLGVLAGMPDVNKAAAKKLLRQVSHHVEQLGIACLTMQDVCVEVQQHVQDVESVMQEPWQRVDTTTFTPGLGLTQALAVLTQLVEPLLTDFHDKSLLSLALSSQANANAVVVAERVIGLETRVPEVEQPLSAEQLTQRSQVWLSVWMLSPKRDVDAEECLLGVLQEALAAAG